MPIPAISELHQWLEDQLADHMIGWRRHLHQHPELSFQERQTPAFIAEKLRQFGLEVNTGIGGNGVIGVLRGAKPGRTVALRADFDALPIQDAKDVPYRSKADGVMHACGHDGHTASLLGVASLLSGRRELLSGSIVFLFQHAEEKPPGGAQAMIADGCLDGVDAVYGIHLSTELPVGHIGVCDGPFMAAVDAFTIEIHGKGGHGARPHETVDSIVIGSRIVGDLQQIVSRRINPLQPAVVTVGKIQGGTAFNVIADNTVIEGTVRTFDQDIRKQIEDELRLIVDGACAASHAAATVSYLNGYPPLVNPSGQIQIVRERIEEHMPELTIVALPPRMGAEDFAYYLQERPGAFINVGARGDAPGTHFPHHHPSFDFDERALVIAAKAFISIVAQDLIR